MPGTYGPGDYTHPKVTALGWQFLDGSEAIGRCFNRRNPWLMADICEEFARAWDHADFVMGHNIKRHDVKILNGLYTALDLPLLPPKRMVDTYMDQPKMQGLSRSLENLAARWNCPLQKIHMPEHVWEKAYDGIPEYVEMMRERVISDVKISIWLYHELVERGLLK